MSLLNWTKHWVIPEKIHTPPIDAMLEILAGKQAQEKRPQILSVESFIQISIA